MKEEALKKLRKMVEEEKKRIKEENKKISKIEKLETDERVTEYINLMGLEKYISKNRPSKISSSDAEIISNIFRSLSSGIGKNETNGIYIYKGAFISEIDYENYWVHRPLDESNAAYKLYFDIERSDCDVEQLSLKDSYWFEKEYIVIKPPIYCEDKYARAIQNEFLVKALSSNQEEAKQYILKKYDKRIVSR